MPIRNRHFSSQVTASDIQVFVFKDSGGERKCRKEPDKAPHKHHHSFHSMLFPLQDFNDYSLSSLCCTFWLSPMSMHYFYRSENKATSNRAIKKKQRKALLSLWKHTHRAGWWRRGEWGNQVLQMVVLHRDGEHMLWGPTAWGEPGSTTSWVFDVKQDDLPLACPPVRWR